MGHSENVLLELFVMFASGKLLGEIYERLRQPAVVGELLAGVLLGPSLLGLVHPSELTRGLAEVGAIFQLFTVGVETKPRDLLKVGWSAALVAEWLEERLEIVVPELGHERSESIPFSEQPSKWDGKLSQGTRSLRLF